METLTRTELFWIMEALEEAIDVRRNSLVACSPIELPFHKLRIDQYTSVLEKLKRTVRSDSKRIAVK